MDRPASSLLGNGSYYAATQKDRAGFDRLSSDIDVDVAIIGGGFTGVATALELAQEGLSVALLEAKAIGWGATGRNGGQVTGSLSGDSAMEREFARTLGQGAAEYVWHTRWRGHEIIQARVKRYQIECDLKFGHLQAALKSSDLKELQKIFEVGSARGMEQDLSLLSAQDIPLYLGTEIYSGGLLNRKNMHLHALDLCTGEARAAQSLGAQIFEAAEVLRIDHGARPKLITAEGGVSADKVLIAGNAYHLLEQKALKGKLFPASLANMATEPLPLELTQRLNPQNLAVYDSRFVLDYYRLTSDNRLMFGGGTNYSGRDSADVVAELRPAMEHTFPQLRGVKIDYAWTGMDGITLNRIPQVAKVAPNVLAVQGYSGHGIGLSHVLAEIVSKALMGDETEFLTYEAAKHWHLPLSRGMGSQAVALGMLAYRLRDRLR
ncbi:MAG: FAD-binding oxidoreductase [Pseudomonadota bacterium]